MDHQTSDDREVVAVWVSRRKNLKEASNFRFLNSGASGEMGDSFSYAVMSGLGTYVRSFEAKETKQKNTHHGGK